MSGTLVIRNRQRRLGVNRPLLRRLTRALMQELRLADFELGISLVGAAEMARLNQHFLGHEGSTDVITFDYSAETQGHPGSGADSPGENGLSGELFICADDAMRQAGRFRTSWQSEVVRYVVHGVLHLLGHDDLRPAARRRMKREENRLVRRLGTRFALADLGCPPARKS